MLERHLHGAHGAFTVRRRRSHVISVGRKTVSCEFTVIFAPRALACSNSSTTTTPAPSLITKPSRSRSNGREARSGSSLQVLSAFMAENPARPISTIDASEPPARKTSASPNLMIRQDSQMALFDVAQAVTIHKFGPCRLNSIEMTPLAMLLISLGIVKGEFREGTFVSRT